MKWNQWNNYYELGAIPPEFQTPGMLNLIATHHKQSPAYHAALQAQYNRANAVNVNVNSNAANSENGIPTVWIAAGATIAAAIIGGLLRKL